MQFYLPKFIRETMPNLVWHIHDDNGVFLTFDDGPTPGITEWILRELDRYDAKATFFCIGKNAELYPELCRQIVDRGHALGNHTHNHITGWEVNAEKYLANINKANEVLHTNLYRPPYAHFTPGQVAQVVRNGYKIVMWNVLSRDYNRNLSQEGCLRNVTKHLKAGSIVVFHDSVKTFKNMHYALPRTLDYIYSKGLVCKPIILK